MVSADDPQSQFREIFLEEALSLLDESEKNLMTLETAENRVDILARIFRAAHSIKGSGASVGFIELAAFAHDNEDCLALLRVMPQKIDKRIVTILLESLDLIRQWISGLKSEGDSYQPAAAVSLMRKQLILLSAQLDGKDRPVSHSQHAQASAAPAAPAADPVREVKTTPLPDSGVAAKEIKTSVSPSAKSKNKVDGKSGKTASFVKIDSERLDAVMDLVGEMVVIKSQILEDESLKSGEGTRLNGLLALLDKNVRDLYDKTLSLRMTSVKGLMQKLERTVRDAALKVNKEVEFVVNGDENEMDRALIERISDPMMHLVRNAVDHGLETAEGRRDAGKSKNGQIAINVFHRGSGIVFDISDDGRGIDRDRIIAKAAEKSLITDVSTARSMSDAEVYNYLFMPGFSTAAKVTDLSGRGVGLDVVKSNVASLKGTVDVSSTPGRGSTFTLRLPLTTAIADGLIVRISEERYIIPLDAVEEVLSCDDVAITPVAGQEDCVEIHGRFIPLVNLKKEFDLAPGEHSLVVVLRSGMRIFAVGVDEIIGQSQVVLKNLHDALAMSRGVAGTAILGDGRVALVVDVAALMPQ
jgi:two-component system chemotaxis sensor kinase CheA